MATRRPLALVAGVLQEITDADSLLYGIEYNTSKDVDSATFTAKTLTARRTILTGTAGASLAVTLPAAAAGIDGMLVTLMSINARSNVTWISSGATFTGAPTSLTGNNAVTFQYHHALTRWFISN